MTITITGGTRIFAALALTLAAGSSVAQEFPSRPIRIIVPYAPGTGSDIASRQIQPQLNERLKQQVIVENRPGAGASIGITALKNAPADGYTIGVLVSGNAASPWLVKDTPFDVRRDFAPITTLYKGPLAMIVPANHPARTLAEFIDIAKRNPRGVTIGTAGIGTTSFLAAELVKIRGGFQGTTINYKGSPEMDAAVVSGDVEYAFDNYVTPRGLVEGGKLRVLATSGLKRMAILPNVPTLAETWPGVEMVFWTGYAAPRGTPAEVVNRLHREISAVLRSPEVVQKFAESGSESGGSTPAEFAKLMADDVDRFGDIIRRAGIQPQ